jgi:hypothetical protein
MLVPAEQITEERINKGKKSDILLQKIKITRKIKQVASHHSRESLSFWNHTKDKNCITICPPRQTFFIK